MFSGHFYHAQIRRMVSVFGTMFNNIEVRKTDSNGNVLETTKVPLAYGPKHKWLARLDNSPSLTDPKLAIKLPRMAFEISALQYDAATALNKTNQIRITDPEDSTKYKTVYGPVPYRIGFQLNIMSKQQDEALQVLEQILPYFKPDFNVTINDVPEMGIKSDVPITLANVTMNDEYEGDMLTRRAIVYTLDFEARIRFYTGIDSKGFIQYASADMNVWNSEETYGFTEEVVAEGDPATLNTEDDIDTTDDNVITP